MCLCLTRKIFLNFSLCGLSKDAAETEMFSEANLNSLEGKIYKENVDDFSFINRQTSIQRTLNSRTHVYMDNLDQFLADENWCKVSIKEHFKVTDFTTPVLNISGPHGLFNSFGQYWIWVSEIFSLHKVHVKTTACYQRTGLL